MHISEITDKKFIKHPLEVVSVGDIVDVKVMSVDLKKKRIQLTMKGIHNLEMKKEIHIINIKMWKHELQAVIWDNCL